jgi:hypothetical protein
VRDPVGERGQLGAFEVQLDEPAQALDAAHDVIEGCAVERAAVLWIEGEAHAAHAG